MEQYLCGELLQTTLNQIHARGAVRGKWTVDLAGSFHKYPEARVRAYHICHQDFHVGNATKNIAEQAELPSLQRSMKDEMLDKSLDVFVRQAHGRHA